MTVCVNSMIRLLAGVSVGQGHQFYHSKLAVHSIQMYYEATEVCIEQINNNQVILLNNV